MNVSEMVEEFAAVTGQEGTPELYATLIQEEFDEWRSEYVRDTKEPQLKELADLVYVLYGYAKVKNVEIMGGTEVSLTTAMSLCVAAKVFLDEIGRGSPIRARLLLQSFRDEIYGYAKVKGWDLETAVQRVHENNLGRCIQPDVDCSECNATGYTYIGCVDGMSRECPACYGEGVHKGIILRRADNKIIKNPDYPKVFLGDLV